jgi:uncharacterized protein YndB with AHSA1/START domain
MADILQDFPIAAPAARVFEAVSTPAGLDCWWTLTSRGTPIDGSEYGLDFGPDYLWTARVVACVPDEVFELELTSAMPDWLGSRVGFRLAPHRNGTWVQFHHTGWAEPSEHYRISSHCWAMYLRLLRRYLEHGEQVPYRDRLQA